MLPELTRWGMLSTLDVQTFAVYCQAVSDRDLCLEQVQALGRMVQTPSGYVMRNPYLTEYYKNCELIRQFGELFGLSPVARVRVAGITQGELFGGPANPAPGKGEGEGVDRFLTRAK